MAFSGKDKKDQTGKLMSACRHVEGSSWDEMESDGEEGRRSQARHQLSLKPQLLVLRNPPKISLIRSLWNKLWR